MPEPTQNPDWPQAMATVLSCTYSARVGRALAFGLPSSKHFHITYNYWAGDAVHTADFYAEKAIPQGSIFPIHYNPDLPQQNQHTHGTTTPTRVPLLAIGIAGSILICLALLLLSHFVKAQ